MWAERARDPARAEALFAQALRYLPGFTAAAIELAELEAARGDLAPAIARLEQVTTAHDEPEALGLLGALRLRTGDPARAALALSRARLRFETLLQRHPLAFADHAAEFYLGAGGDPERAWSLAAQNLAARPTARAFDLAIAAARATGRAAEARDLVADHRRARGDQSQ
jgi:tetratricopeptide (TPR) repeat protein